MPKMLAADLAAFLHREFPQVDGYRFSIERVDDAGVSIRMPYQDQHLRPGGTISGPALMTLADTAMYAAVLSAIGPVPLAVTTNLGINFLRRPRQSDVVAEARLLKVGKRLAVGDVALFSDGIPEMVAHATLTYSIPDRR